MKGGDLDAAFKSIGLDAAVLSGMKMDEQFLEGRGRVPTGWKTPRSETRSRCRSLASKPRTFSIC